MDRLEIAYDGSGRAAPALHRAAPVATARAGQGVRDVLVPTWRACILHWVEGKGSCRERCSHEVTLRNNVLVLAVAPSRGAAAVVWPSLQHGGTRAAALAPGLLNLRLIKTAMAAITTRNTLRAAPQGDECLLGPIVESQSAGRRAAGGWQRD